VAVIVGVSEIGPVIVAVHLNGNDTVEVIGPSIWGTEERLQPGRDHDHGVVPVHVHGHDHGSEHAHVDDHGHDAPFYAH